jgi:hypothetical protein
MPLIYLPPLGIAIIALLIFLHGFADFPSWLCCHLKGVMSKHFAIDMELFHLSLHLPNLEMCISPVSWTCSYGI